MGEGVPCDLELLRIVAEQRPPGDLRFRKDTICAASIAGTTMYGAPHAIYAISAEMVKRAGLREFRSGVLSIRPAAKLPFRKRSSLRSRIWHVTNTDGADVTIIGGHAFQTKLLMVVDWDRCKLHPFSLHGKGGECSGFGVLLYLGDRLVGLVAEIKLSEVSGPENNKDASSSSTGPSLSEAS